MKNKKMSKRILVMICVAALLVGSISSLAAVVNNLSDSDTTNPWEEYERITMADFDIEASADENGTEYTTDKSGTYTGTSLNKTYLDVDIKYSGSSLVSNYINFFGSGNWAGYLRITSWESGTGLAINDPENNYGVSPVSVDGITKDTFFNFKMLTDIVEDEKNAQQTVTLQFYRNDEYVGKAEWTEAMGTNHDVFYICINKSDGPITLRTPAEGKFAGYTRITMADFDIEASADENGTEYTTDKSGTYTGTSLNKTYLDVDIKYSGSSLVSNYINFFGSGNWAGYLRITSWESGTGLAINDPENNYGVSPVSVDGITKDTFFNFKMLTDIVEDEKNAQQTVTLQFYRNDEYVGKAEWTEAMGANHDVFYICMNKSEGPITLRTPVIDDASQPDGSVDPNLPTELTGYTKITLEQFGLEASTEEEGTQYSSGLTGNFTGESLNKTYLDVDVNFHSSETGATYFQYLHEADWGQYVRISPYSTGVSIFEGPNTKNQVWVNSDLNDDFFNLKLAVDMTVNAADSSKSDVKLQVWVENVLQGTLEITGTTTEMTEFYIYIKSGDKISFRTPTIESTEPDTPEEPVVPEDYEKLKDITYELSSGAGYLLTGTGTLYVNEVETKVGTSLTKPGDYVVKRVVDAETTYVQKISLYKNGDVNLGGGEEWTADDQAELASIIHKGTTSNAKMKAADINNDGKVSKSDLMLMKQVVAGKMDEDEVAKQYHVPAVSYDYLGGDTVMPIGGYYGPYSEATVTDAIYKAIAESGVNLIVKSNMDYCDETKQPLIEQGLALAQQYGLGVFVSDGRLNSITKDENGLVTDHSYISDATEIAKLLSDYSACQSFLGTMIIDEPILDKGFDQISTTDYRRFTYYKGIATALNSYDNLTGYVNLLGNYHMPEDITYEAYLREVGKSMKALSFDSYPFYEKDGVSGGLMNYLQSLGTISKVAREDGFAFWSCVQAGTDYRDNGEEGETTGYLTQAQTLWNVNTSLAFGAKGIVYFPLIQPTNYANVDGSTYDYNRNGIIGANNAVNAYYDDVQLANKQIVAADEVLMKAQNKGVIATEQAAVDTVDVDSILTGTSRLLSVNGDDALVGCFDYRDTEAFYVVAYDYEATTEQTITLNFGDTYQYRIIQNGVTSYGEGNALSITASAGEGVLVVLEDHVVYYEDISVYRSEDGYTAPEAPKGYIFAGWYSDKACTKENAIATDMVDTAAYAKFVDANLMNVKAQITAGTTADSSSTSIRFVTSVNDLMYQKVGFKINIHKDTGVSERDYSNNVVYKVLTAMVGDTTWNYTPQELFCGMATYFKAQVIQDIPNASFDTVFEVIPYWVTLDGTTVYGTTVHKTVSQGIQ